MRHARAAHGNEGVSRAERQQRTGMRGQQGRGAEREGGAVGQTVRAVAQRIKSGGESARDAGRSRWADAMREPRHGRPAARRAAGRHRKVGDRGVADTILGIPRVVSVR